MANYINLGVLIMAISDARLRLSIIGEMMTHNLKPKVVEEKIAVAAMLALLNDTTASLDACLDMFDIGDGDGSPSDGELDGNRPNEDRDGFDPRMN